MTCKLLANNVEWSIKTLMNGDVSLSLIGCFFVIKSNIAIFRQLHYLQHKRPWEFSVWTRTTIENNMNHSCKNGFPPCLTFMQFVPISESLMNTWIIKDRVRVALDDFYCDIITIGIKWFVLLIMPC